MNTILDLDAEKSPRSGPGRASSLPVIAGAAPRPRSRVPGGAGNALTLVNRIKPGRRPELLALLAAYGRDVRHTTAIRFGELRSVHFLRWVVLDGEGGDGTLVLESNHDGTPEAHLDELLRVGGPGMHAIYGHTAGYPAGGAALGAADLRSVKLFLLDHAAPYGAFHAANRGKTADRIRHEAEVRRALEDALDARRRLPAFTKLAPLALYRGLRSDVEARGLLAPLLDDEDPAPTVQGWRGVRELLALAGPFLPLLPFVVATLLWKERRDPADRDATGPRPAGGVKEMEDLLTQNQLTHVVTVKPGPFRRWLLRKVLRAVDVLARLVYNQGSLGSIATIHFARWVLVDQGRTLVFFSNYDGSWESYLGDFVDKGSVGLSSLWSNTTGFPRTVLLALAGARDEERFKTWARAHQIVTPLWYSGYPEVTARNVREHARLCQGLARPLTDDAAAARWLEDL